MALNVLYVTNNAGRASTTIATQGWIEHLEALKDPKAAQQSKYY